jgi:hypothetical protein
MASVVFAQSATVVFVEAQNINDTGIKKIQKAVENAFKMNSNFEIAEGPAFSKSAPKKCEIGCAQEVARGIQTAAVLTLEAKALDTKGEKVSILLNLFVDGESEGTKKLDSTIDALDAPLKATLDALIPTFMKKGFGALRVSTDESSVVKIDGKVANVKAGELVSVPAGFHTVDVVSSTGNAISQRIEVAEGSRSRVGEVPELEIKKGSGAAFSALRGTSYALFMAGSVSLAVGLIAGALGKGAVKDVVPCSNTLRDCTTLDVALQKQAAAESYANTGNIFLGVGAGLLTAGVGLFAIDAVIQ